LLTPRELGASPYCWQCPGAAPVRHVEPWESDTGMHRAMTSDCEDQVPREPCWGCTIRCELDTENK
jgi:hypothetical protein